jgi:UDP-glucose 4-epimerase
MYNVGTGIPTSVNALFEHLAELTGYGEPARHEPPLPGEVFRIFVTNDRAREELGWQPTVSLAEGLRRTVEQLQRDAARSTGGGA